MDITFVTQVALDRPFGGARHVLAVARELAQLKHRVCLFGPGQEPAEADVERVRPPFAPGPGARLEALLAAQVGLHVRARRPDVAYVRISASSSAVPFTLRTLGIPVVLELNGRILDELAELGRPPAVISVVQRTLRAVVASAAALVAVEAKIGRHAEEALGAKNVHVIENGADLRAATPGDRAAARAQLGLPQDAELVAFAGTLVPELRLELLAGALDRLPGVKLVVAGGGPGEAKLAALASARPGRIVSLGARPHADAIALLRAADVAVNVRDGDLGMKCLEYAAVGRRFVSFRVEGAERLQALYPGLEAVHLVDVRSEDALAGAIRGALDAERARGPLPAEAIAAVRAQVGWDHTARRIAEVLERAR